MTFGLVRILRPAGHLAGWVALAGACVAAVACSNTPPPVADTFISATMGSTPTSPSTVCSFASQTTWLDIGAPTGNKPQTVADGNSQAGANVHVTCTVSPSGGGFNISVNAVEDGLSGGSLTITGTVDTSGGQGITGVFQSAQNGRYAEQDCTITYKYNSGDVPVSPPVAGGRIWGHLSCPSAQISGQTVTLPDGGTGPRQCDGEADFLFEQCGQ